MSLRNLLAIAREAAVACKMAAGLGDKLWFASDVLLSRGLKFGPMPGFNETRTVLLADGVSLSYRLNRGDVQGIREVWMDGAYRLPFAIKPQTIIDLGANIGLSSTWFYKQFKSAQIIAVEANAANAALTRLNFEKNAIPGEVIHAAIGPEDGTAVFQSFDESNVGRIAGSAESQAPGVVRSTVEVPMVSMASVLSRLPAGQRIDLVKMDIEGGEALLLSRNTGWLERVDAIIAELHPEVVDCAPVIATIEAAGFTFIPGHSVFPGNLTAFIRSSHPAAMALHSSSSSA